MFSVCHITWSLFCTLVVVGANYIKFVPEKHKNWNLVEHEACGSSSHNRIIGGKKASVGQYPWIVLIGIRIPNLPLPHFYCGGAVLNDKYILTAAHCIEERYRPTLFVRLGEYDMSKQMDCQNGYCAPPVQDINTSLIIPHPDYKPMMFQFDIGLIRLARPARLDEFVLPICLPTSELIKKDYLHQQAETAGFGITNSSTRDRSSVLLYVHLPVVDLRICEKIYGNKGTVDESHLCAGGEAGRDTCDGDSGGPLMMAETKKDDYPRYYLLGVVCYGLATCGKSPALYTKIAYYMDWILDNLSP